MDTLYTGLVITRRKTFAGSVTGTPTVSTYRNGTLVSTVNGTGSGATWVFAATVPSGDVGDSIQVEASGVVSGQTQVIVLAEGQLVALQSVQEPIDADGLDLEEAMRIALAALAGKVSGGGTSTNVIKAADDSKTRITATVDANGNRTAITLDAT
jgi:hypothetical protein